jgi:hypothetical protein
VRNFNNTPYRSMGEWKSNSAHSLNSALDGGNWSASRTDRFTLGDGAPGTDKQGAYWVQSRSGHGGEEKNVPASAGNRSPVIHPVTYTDWDMNNDNKCCSTLCVQCSNSQEHYRVSVN